MMARQLTKNRLVAMGVFALVAVVSGCGGGSSSGTVNPPPPPTPSVTITCPSNCTTSTGGTLQLSATVQNLASNAVTWSLVSTNNGTATNVGSGNSTYGKIDGNGKYTAPDFVPAGTLVAKAVASDNTTSSNATITITQGTLPTFVAYTNDDYGGATTTCPTCTPYVERVFSFHEGNPGGQVQVSPDDTNSQDLYPVIKRDKTAIAYIKQGTSESLVVAPTDGGATTLVKNWTSQYFTPSMLDWNPSGTGFVLAYSDTTAKVCGLATLTLDGSTFQPIPVTQITCLPGTTVNNPPDSPKYLTDGRILYTKQQKAYILSADLTTETAIPNVSAISLSISPDGNNIVYDGTTGISRATLDGTGIQNLVGAGVYPTWCPDNVIIYANLVNGVPHLFSIPADGSTDKPTPVTTWNSDFPSCR